MAIFFAFTLGLSLGFPIANWRSGTLYRNVGTVLLFVLMATGVAFAQNTSTTQMQLVNSSTFTTRLQYLLTSRASSVLDEAQSDSANANTNLRYTAACHSLRAGYAAQVIGNPAPNASTAAVLVSSANFAGAVIVGTVTGSGNTADSSASDTAIDTALQNLWNHLAKCVTNP